MYWDEKISLCSEGYEPKCLRNKEIASKADVFLLIHLIYWRNVKLNANTLIVSLLKVIASTSRAELVSASK